MQEYIEKWPFTVVESEDEGDVDRPVYKVVFKDKKTKVEIGTKYYYAEQISAYVLNKIRESA